MDEEYILKFANAIGTLKKDVKSLSERTSEVSKQQGPKGDKGDKGDPGLPGAPGKDGKDGLDGKDGIDGKDGVSITDAYMAADGDLVLKLSDGKELATTMPLQSTPSSSSSSVLKQIAAGPRIYVQATAPADAQVGDIWFDIS